jgi:hypothetical protein
MRKLILMLGKGQAELAKLKDYRTARYAVHNDLDKSDLSDFRNGVAHSDSRNNFQSNDIPLRFPRILLSLEQNLDNPKLDKFPEIIS